MFKRFFFLWMMGCGLSILPILAQNTVTESTPSSMVQTSATDTAVGAIPVMVEWKQELFQRSGQDLLADYKVGDVLVAEGRFDKEEPSSLLFYGQQGQLALPVDLPAERAGVILKLRCRVMMEAGRKTLEPIETIDTFDARSLLEKAADDYRTLLPQIRIKTAVEGSHLKLDETPKNPFEAAPSYEGRDVVYITLRQADLMYVCDVAFRYERIGKDYLLTRCWAFQWFKGE